MGQNIGERFSSLPRRLWSQWLRLGLAPTMAAGLLALGAGAAHATPIQEGSRGQELQLQGAMAIVAALFLAGFWIEGWRTDTTRILLGLSRALRKQLSDLTPRDLCESAADVERVAVEAQRTALMLGWGAALVPVVAAVAGMPVAHIVVVAALALLYELYLLSRHRHAVEVVSLAASGDLAYEAAILAKYLAFRPTVAQRVAMLFGWRPHFQLDSNPAVKRKSTRARN
ncbi:MAG: hypothetical protein N2512_06455 [Armatimonadetes bacterium]|nr:hypothetical protein [Armatimonadota bacterium]